MEPLKQLDDAEICALITQGSVTVSDLVDAGICPTCFDKRNHHLLYGSHEDKMLYEDERFECFLVGNPRADGHAAISTKKHFKDLTEADDETCRDIFLLAKKTMLALKEAYHAESVYVCTMCDGPMNHFHVQLIPRFSFEKRGSGNFVKPRFAYREDPEKLTRLRNALKGCLS